MKKLWQSWNEFWFGEVSLLNLAVFRIFLGSTLFFMYLSRQFDVAAYYGPDSFIPRSLSMTLAPDFYQMSFPWYFWPDSWAAGVHLVFVLSLLLLVLGLAGRALVLLAWIFHMGFLYRNYSVAFGADLIGGIFLLYLAGTQCCTRLSIKTWLRDRILKRSEAMPLVLPKSDLMTSIFYRLIQIQLCVIYAFTGFEKLKGGSWWDGTALWTVLANSQISAFDFTWMRAFPTVIAVATFTTIAFEIYFPVLVWFKQTAKFLLALGLFFHVGIAFALALPTFSAVMLAPYLLFLSEETLQTAKNRLTRVLIK